MFNFGNLDLAGWIVPVAAILGWVLITLYRMYLVGRTREQAHRERLTMIEKGLVPPPEADPQMFERMTDWHPSGGVSGPGARQRRSGITLIGVGVGLMVMLNLVGGGRAWGIGAFRIVLGIAFLVNAMLESRPRRDQQPRTPGSPTGT